MRFHLLLAFGRKDESSNRQTERLTDRKTFSVLSTAEERLSTLIWVAESVTTINPRTRTVNVFRCLNAKSAVTNLRKESILG